jgi:ribose transport system substrate-binding protein
MDGCIKATSDEEEGAKLMLKKGAKLMLKKGACRMKILNIICFFVLLIASFFIFVCDSATNQPYRVAVVAKALDSEFWQEVKRGAEEAARDYNDVKLSVLAPTREINIHQQVNILEDQIMKRVSAISVAPCGSAEIIPMLEKAYLKASPVISFGSDIEWDKKTSFVGTDNRLGGRLAGEYIVKALSAKGKIAVLRGILGIHDHEERVSGFLDAIKLSEGIKVVAVQPANSERDLALTVMENILTSNPDLDAVFITSDQMALGALEAIEAHQLSGKLIVVGFDGGREAIQAIKDGRLTAEVAQNPYNIGRQAFLAAYQAAKGEQVEKRIDTGTELIDKSNVDKFFTSDNKRTR